MAQVAQELRRSFREPSGRPQATLAPPDSNCCHFDRRFPCA